jgi:hypothetical protein
MVFARTQTFVLRLFCVALSFLVTASVYAREGEQPYSWQHPTGIKVSEVPQVALAAVDRTALLAEDSRQLAPASNGAAVEKRLRVAVGNTIRITPQNDGIWETLADGSRLWRLTVRADNATDLGFGFSRYQLPAGASLYFIDETAHSYEGPYVSSDATPDNQFWSPPVAGSAITLELHLPAGAELASDSLVLNHVGAGYRNVRERSGAGLFGAGASGDCNIDVICPLGDAYRNEIRSVAKYYFQSGADTYLCTGSLVMNTAHDFKNYFLTANHCISTQAEATTISLIWNYQSPTCGAHGGGSTSQTQTGGATLRSHRADVDVTLVELNSAPPSAYNVFYAGWDASGVVPGGSIGIHHPSGWVKAITLTDHALTTMNSCIGTGGSQSHWRTGSPYAQGTTEGGSSGSAIFVPAGDASGHQNLIIGTLSGGSALCNGSVPNSGYDCYGKFSVAWDGTSSVARLKDWLDPGNTGATTQTGSNANDTIFKNGFDAN